MTTQPDKSNVPRTTDGAFLLSPDVRRGIIQLLGADHLTTRTLRAPWNTPSVFAISNFSDASFEWVLKSLNAREKGTRVILLLSADTQTVGGQTAIRTCQSVLFVSGKQIANRATMLLGFGVDLSPLGWLGIVLTPFRGNP